MKAFKEGCWIYIPCIIVGIICWLINPWIALAPGIFLLYSLYFFRDPKRSIPQDENAIISAADGVVVYVDEDEDQWFGNGQMKRVAVFLSVFDVHVNRAPVSGKIARTSYCKGQFLDARNPDAALRNENRNWLFENVKGPVVMRQIAGLIARRIVHWNDEGDEVNKGQKIGLIRFGSRTDIYLPNECEVSVKPGDRVKGGESIIARWPQ
ncbi:MAG: phosphatidylserine decarboxylase family protein [Verrucomicrobiota bacterium]